MKAMRASMACCSVLIASLALGGCASLHPPAPVDDPPHEVPLAPFAGGGPRVALVLSGGSARAFAHVGVLKVLEANGLRPDIVVGASGGSLVGALYASGLSISQVEEAVSDVDASLLSDVVLPKLGALPGELGLVRGEKLRAFLASRLAKARIEDFPIRFAAVATNLHDGSPVILNAGDAATAVQASTAIPGLVAPVQTPAGMLADGQISAPVPVDAARRLHADVVIAVDVVYPPTDAVLTSPLRVVFQAFAISTYRLREMQLRTADVIIAPDIPATSGQYGPAAWPMLVEAGEKAATQAIAAIKAAIERGARR